MFRRKFRVFELKNVRYPKVSEIIWKFIQKDEKNYNKLRNNLCHFKNIFEYVYSKMYPEVYCVTEGRGFDLKSKFRLVFKTYKDKKVDSTNSEKFTKLSGGATQIFRVRAKTNRN